MEEGKHAGGEDVAGAQNGVSEKKPEGEGGEPSACSVVPLSLALHQLGVAGVDLLKVDVEGDELAVLHGIDDEDWPKIRQARLDYCQGKDASMLSSSLTLGSSQCCRGFVKSSLSCFCQRSTRPGLLTNTLTSPFPVSKDVGRPITE